MLELNKQLDGIDDEVIEMFKNYNWPGNLREFRNVVRRASLLTATGLINKNVLPWEIVAGNMNGVMGNNNSTKEQEAFILAPKITTTPHLKDAATQAEYEAIISVLKQVKYNKSKAAQILKIDRKTLYNKMKAYEDLNE